MWKKADFRRVIKARIASIDKRRAAEPVDAFVSVTYSDEKEYREALLWLSGEPTNIDFKVESRHNDGVWRHTLMNGSLGYSAANALVVVPKDLI